MLLHHSTDLLFDVVNCTATIAEESNDQAQVRVTARAVEQVVLSAPTVPIEAIDNIAPAH